MKLQKLVNFVIVNFGEFLSGVAYTLPFAIYPNKVKTSTFFTMGIRDMLFDPASPICHAMVWGKKIYQLRKIVRKCC